MTRCSGRRLAALCTLLVLVAACGDSRVEYSDSPPPPPPGEARMDEIVARMHASAAAREAESAPAFDYAGLERPEGGRTVGELHADRAALAGREVVVRGKVVRFNAGILGKNWLHVRDGTGAAGTNDLTVTTDATAKLGDTVLVRGRLVLDQDLGFGYKYDLILEEAEVTVE